MKAFKPFDDVLLSLTLFECPSSETNITLDLTNKIKLRVPFFISLQWILLQKQEWL